MLLSSIQAWIGIGANIGDDPAEAVRQAIKHLGSTPHCRVLAYSSLYRTAPMGCDTQPDYINAVAQIETALGPTLLLETLLTIEKKFGRVRTVPNAPRTLDLDLLLYGEQTIHQPGIEVPHPRMQERAFVLKPLCEISPDLIIPGRGKVAELLAALPDQRVLPLDD